MQKPTYVFLLIVTILLLAYTLYYSSTHPPVVQAPLISFEATTTAEISFATTTEIAPNNTLTTQSGKTLLITETHPNGESLSSVTITPSGFATNTPISLETNKLTSFFLLDMNKDGFEELVLITTAQGSGSYGEAIIYTTAHDQGLIPVAVPKIIESDSKKGGLFEGYMGHDTFSTSSAVLTHEFPTFTATDTNSLPSGPNKKVYYVLNEKNGIYSVTFSKDVPATTSTSTPLTATTTALSKTSWVWTSSTIGTTTVPSPKGDMFTLVFDATKTMHATTDCNTLAGNYLANTKEVQISDITSTKKQCENSSEDIYQELLTQAKTYTLQGSSLILTISGKDTLVFRKK